MTNLVWQGTRRFNQSQEVRKVIVINSLEKHKKMKMKIDERRKNVYLQIYTALVSQETDSFQGPETKVSFPLGLESYPSK